MKYLQIELNNRLRHTPGFIPEMQLGFNKHKPQNITLYINRTEDKIYIIFSIDVENIFDKIVHLFMMKAQKKN
jgi:hypothetical protein